jgi:hypothetical protein
LSAAFLFLSPIEIRQAHMQTKKQRLLTRPRRDAFTGLLDPDAIFVKSTRPGEGQ